MTENEDDRQRRGVTASLLLQPPQTPTGPTPTADEIWDWMHSQLPADRAEEIKNHIAADASVYETWRQLRLALAEDDASRHDAVTPPTIARTTPRNTLPHSISDMFRRWLRPVAPVLATSVVCLFALGIYILADRAPDHVEFWADWQQPKGQTESAPAATIRAHQAILAGMRQKMTTLSIAATTPTGESLPSSSDACLVSADCQNHAIRLNELGQQLVSAHLSCRQSMNDPRASLTWPESINELTTLNLIVSLHYPLSQWRDASSIDEQCLAVEQAIGRILASA